jgi:putative lipoprotein
MNIARLTGSVGYMTRELMPEVTMTVELRDVSLQEGQSLLIASTTRLVPQGGSLAYALEYDPQVLQQGHTYSVSASIYLAGRLYKVTTTQHKVELPETSSLDIQVHFPQRQEPCDHSQPVEGIHGGNHPSTAGIHGGNLFDKS